MAIDTTKLNKFVGMLGSEHAGEQSNAASFIKKMAAAEKLSMVEFLTKAYGGGRERIVEKIVYRDRPADQGPTGSQQQAYRNPGSKSSFDEQYARAKKQYTEDRPPQGEEERAAWEMRQERERNYGRRERPKSKAYGHNGDIKDKIKTVLENHSMSLTKWEKDFLSDLVERLYGDREMTPQQRVKYMQIMEKVGYA